MRKYAYLKEPLKQSGRTAYKIMLYETEEGVYLFEYDSPDAIQCSADSFYERLEDVPEFDDLIDERGWIELEDPLPHCQHDALIPLRIKGRESGKPEWGKYEILLEGQWRDYDPESADLYQIKESFRLQ